MCGLDRCPSTWTSSPPIVRRGRWLWPRPSAALCHGCGFQRQQLHSPGQSNQHPRIELARPAMRSATHPSRLSSISSNHPWLVSVWTSAPPARSTQREPAAFPIGVQRAMAGAGAPTGADAAVRPRAGAIAVPGTPNAVSMARVVAGAATDGVAAEPLELVDTDLPEGEPKVAAGTAASMMALACEALETP